MSIAATLAELLADVHRPGDFHCSGSHEIAAPGLEVEGVGPIALLRHWQAEGAPQKLIYPLDHAYTSASLSFAALKGADAARAATLVSAAQAAECDVHLALVAIEESGWAEHTGYSRSYRRGRDDDEDAFEIGEVDDYSQTLSGWLRPDDSDPGLGELPIEDGELSPPDAFEGLAPDEQSFQEATGNEGATFERSYRRTAPVLWPRRWRLAVLNQAGLQSTLPYLAALSKRWLDGDGDLQSPLWAEAHELSGHMLNSWPIESRRDANAATLMLTPLRQLRDVVRIEKFLADIVSVGVYGKDDNDGIALAVRLLTPVRAVALLTRIVKGNIDAALDGCGDLLARITLSAMAKDVAFDAADLKPVAVLLVAELPGDPARERAPSWQRPRPIPPEAICDILTALEWLKMGQSECRL